MSDQNDQERHEGDHGGGDHVRAFYARHPISAGHIVETLRARHGGLDGLRPDDLFPPDQDHYGGIGANAALAELAGMAPGVRVADFCAGLGGPARWWAHRRGVQVTGVELTDEMEQAINEVHMLHANPCP